MSGRRQLRVVVVEDQDLYRQLLGVALAAQPGVEVVGTFADGEAALQAAPRLVPDAALLDIELPGSLDGVHLGLRLRSRLPRLGVVLLSHHREPERLAAVPRSEMAGWSYLLKKSLGNVQALLRAIEGSVDGLVVLDPDLVAYGQPRSGTRLAALDSRGRELLALIAEGYSNTAIAARLHLTAKTVENEVSAIYDRLALRKQGRLVHLRVAAALAYIEESRFAVPGDNGGRTEASGTAPTPVEQRRARG